MGRLCKKSRGRAEEVKGGLRGSPLINSYISADISS